MITNFAITLDGRATIQGRSGAIGSDADTQMLVGLRTKVDAVMIGAGTLRVERYGRIVPDPERRARREREGLSPDPLAVVVSGRLDVPWDAPLFTEGAGQVLIFTASRDRGSRRPRPRYGSFATRVTSTWPRRSPSCAPSEASEPCSARAGPLCTPS